MHKRTLIKNQVIQILTGLSTTGSNVFGSRIYGLSDDQLPAIKVFLGDGQILDDSEAGYQAIEEADLLLECVVKENDDYDDTLEQILFEIQTAISDSRADVTAGSLNQIAHNYFYSAVENLEYESGEQDQGGQVVIYRVQYEQTI